MLKASALRAVTDEMRTEQASVTGIHALIRQDQNIRLDSFEEKVAIPRAVENIAHRMMRMDKSIREFLSEFRSMYSAKKEDFHFPLADKSEEEIEEIVRLFEDLQGVIGQPYYCAGCKMLHGKLLDSSRGLRFINGQYLEIALFKEAREVLEELSQKHKKPYKLYRNVTVSTKEGILKNEFDLVIDFAGTIYLVEIKSGKQFKEFEKYTKIGRTYGVVPDRFLLVDNYLSEEQTETISYFCEYHVSNLAGNNFAEKLTMMIENDL